MAPEVFAVIDKYWRIRCRLDACPSSGTEWFLLNLLLPDIEEALVQHIGQLQLDQLRDEVNFQLEAQRRARNVCDD